jgi:hypothetical protein
MLERGEPHQCSERMVVLLSLKYFQKVIIGKSILIATTNTTVVLYIQIGLTLLFSLYLLCKDILLFYDSRQTRLSLKHVARNHDMIVDGMCHPNYQPNTSRMGITASFVSS